MEVRQKKSLLVRNMKSEKSDRTRHYQCWTEIKRVVFKYLVNDEKYTIIARQRYQKKNSKCLVIVV